ncbi:MAG: PAS domain-containing protein, partial [Aliifodinibius sp.]|nr:PAS domain-containing protein [Fodinibius sp.]
MKNKIRILILSDNTGKVSLVRKGLKKAKLKFISKSSKTKKSFEKDLSAFKPDIIISHVSSKKFDTATALQIADKQNNTIPFICICSSANIRQAASLTKNGTDNLIMVKDLNLLGPTIKSVLENKHSELEETLKRRNIFIEIVLNNLPIGLAVNTIDDGKLQYMNAKFEEIYGWPGAILNSVDSFFKHVYPDPKYRKKIKERVLSDIKSGDPSRMVWENVKVTG